MDEVERMSSTWFIRGGIRLVRVFSHYARLAIL
jgi:hypothetical protein